MKAPTIVVLVIGTWAAAYFAGAIYAKHQNDQTWKESAIAYYVVQHHQATADNRELFVTCDGRDYRYGIVEDKPLESRLVAERPDVPLLPRFEPATAFSVATSMYVLAGVKTLPDFESLVWKEATAKPTGLLLLASGGLGFWLGHDQHMERSPSCSRPAFKAVVEGLDTWHHIRDERNGRRPARPRMLLDADVNPFTRALLAPRSLSPK